ncbi:GNAT family N-acetyltransferase [Niastella caeni]|uniref:GNAT family N-acetyltransferase n=1 Tax=Niastella caeni TaxID=2569763 RepID=A0A4S8I2V4_9BACT|nr:GNAT family N-acetyltransferase [Niastella caeni]THU40282.1 GNAT family N-acetyltransferase [Niastella caeni]
MHTIKRVDDLLKKKLEPLFVNHHCADLGIKSILEGQSGKQIKVVVDNAADPNIALIRYGTFGILAGNASHAAASALVQSIDLPCAIQPSPETWISLLQNKYADNIKRIERYSFTHEHIDTTILKEIIAEHPNCNALQEIDTVTAYAMEHDEWHKYHFLNYDSPEDFATKGFACGININGGLASACSAALRCTSGIELNVITLPAYRNQGLAAVAAACTIKRAMEQNLIPHWDAANERSARLAMRLGYKPAGSYYTWFVPA